MGLGRASPGGSADRYAVMSWDARGVQQASGWSPSACRATRTLDRDVPSPAAIAGRLGGGEGGDRGGAR